MKDGLLEEISFVDVPADPLARQKSVTINNDELREILGSVFQPGMPLNCDHCLGPYHGLPEPLNISGLSGEQPGDELL